MFYNTNIAFPKYFFNFYCSILFILVGFTVPNSRNNYKSTLRVLKVAKLSPKIRLQTIHV